MKGASGHSRRHRDSGKLSGAGVRNLSARSEAFLEAVCRRRPEHSLFPQAGLGTIIPFVQNIAAQRRSKLLEHAVPKCLTLQAAQREVGHESIMMGDTQNAPGLSPAQRPRVGRLDRNHLTQTPAWRRKGSREDDSSSIFAHYCLHFLRQFQRMAISSMRSRIKRSSLNRK